MEWKIPLPQNKFAVVDEADGPWLIQWKWSIYKNRTGSFYAVRRDKKNRPVYLHREILGLYFGDSRQGDHINGDTLNNSRNNLRIVTQAQNVRNRRIPRTNTSGYKGVCFDNGKYRAKIYANGKQIYLGYTKTAEEAAALYAEASRKYHGEHGRIK